MLILNALSGGANALPGNISLIDALPDLTNLQLCVDVGDSNSLASDAANTALEDLSANGNDMQAGTTAGADSQDPAFSGTIGALSNAEFVTMDGVQDSALSDLYTFATNPAWLETIHKDSAVFTVLTIVQFTSASGVFSCGNITNSANVGFEFFFDKPNPRMGFRVAKGGGGFALEEIDTGLDPDTNTWLLAAVSIDEDAGSGLLYLNGNTSSFTSTYSSPSASAASTTFSFGASNLGAATSLQSVDSRFAAAAVFQGRALDAAELNAIHENLSNRFQFGE